MKINNVDFKSPELGAQRTTDSGIILKTNITGGLIPPVMTSKTQDIRLYTFTLTAAKADELFNLVEANIGKLMTFVVTGETFSGIVSADEFELSTVRPGVCGLKKCALRIRVVTRSGPVGVNTECSMGISDEAGLTIYDESGGIIYADE